MPHGLQPDPSPSESSTWPALDFWAEANGPIVPIELPDPRPKVVIVGGGLTGLVAAHALTRGEAPVTVTLLEARERLGGAIWTTRRDGFLLEGGADSFITNKPSGVELCRELGLELVGPSDAHRRSFVVRKGKLLPVPAGFVLMAPNRLRPLLGSPVLSWRGKLRVLFEPLVPRRDEPGDESLASFVRRRLGREAFERLVQPLVGGIYTADPNELSLAATLPQFPAMEREHGGLLRGAWHKSRTKTGAGPEAEASGARYGLFAAPNEGMGELIASLARALPAGTVKLNVPVRRIAKSESGRWRVEQKEGPPIEADAVVLATEAHAAARLADGFDPELAAGLRGLPYASSTIVSLGLRRDQVGHPLDGFGCVVPQIEGRRALAISFTSVKFPDRAPEGHVLLRVFLGGATQPEMFDHADEEAARIALEEASALLGIKGPPVLVEVSRHPRAMPQYTLGHLDRVAAVQEQVARHPGAFLAGNAYGGVGVPDCVRSGKEAARAVLAALASKS